MSPVTSPARAALHIVLAVALAALAAGCIGQPPPRTPTLPLVDVKDGTVLDASSRTSTFMSTKKTVCGRDVEALYGKYCVDHKVPPHEVTMVSTTVKYGERDLSFAELSMLANPELREGKAELDRLTERCKGARVPGIVSYVLFSVGAAVASGGRSNGNDTVMYAGGGVALGGLALYGLAHVAFGGSSCGPARELYSEIGSTLNGLESYTEPVTVNREDEIKQLVRRFNREHGSRTARQPEAPADADTDDTDDASDE